MKNVLVVNVGPVQGYIATARKTRDLWFGSWLLSELSTRVASEIHDKCNGEIIAPTMDAATSGMMVNHITAVLDEKDVQTLQDLFPAALRKRLLEEWNQIQSLGDLDEDIDAIAQLSDLPECVWAAVPITTDYKSARDEAERLLAARKATRDFAPVTWGAPKVKSSLDGVRESVIPESAYAPAHASPAEQQKYKNDLYRKYKAGPAERLSAVDLLKRHGGGDHPVASTSHMAALPLVMRMNAHAEKVQNAITELLKSLQTAGVDLQPLNGTGHAFAIVDNVDASFLFESRLKHDPLGKPLSESQAELATNALRAFYATLGKGWSPTPYFALLVADGDNMGVVVDAQTTEAEHKALSSALSGFAIRARAIVDSSQFQGLSVYAGGDDVLALLPVHTALACASMLHSEFHNTLKSFAAKSPEGKQVLPSLSVGIVIAHHLEPLSVTLRFGRDAEATAKGVAGKDALAITLAKRNGANRTVAGRWDSNISQRLTDFVNLHLAAAIPDGAAYELQALHRRLYPPRAHKPTDTGGTETALLKALSKFERAEAARIIGRKMAEQGTQPVAPDIKQRLQTELDTASDIEQVALELMIAGELAKACAAAGLSTAPALVADPEVQNSAENAAKSIRTEPAHA